MTIQLRTFRPKLRIYDYVQDVSFIAKGLTMKPFLQISIYSVIYETFPIQNFSHIQ